LSRNSTYFQPPAVKETYLRVRGFNPQGQRSGGLILPVEVDLPAGTILVRLYHDVLKKFGEWWFTPQEMHRVADYFARSGPGFTVGRSQGNGILHAVLAVRHDWSHNDPQHLGRFFAVRLGEPLKAYHGEADDAPNPGYGQMQKAARILGTGGEQRRVRQVFLPHPWEYKGAFSELGDHWTDAALLGAIERYRRSPLYFET
jgi:hypothetical protein